jgi:hypothetical protein
VAKRTWRPGARSDPTTRFADAVSTWLETYPGPPDGLIGLRDLGASVNKDLAADLDLKPIRTLRLSLELLGTLAEGEGLDPETLHIPQLRFSRLSLAVHIASVRGPDVR